MYIDCGECLILYLQAETLMICSWTELEIHCLYVTVVCCETSLSEIKMYFYALRFYEENYLDHFSWKL